MVINTYKIKRAIEANRHKRLSQLLWRLRNRCLPFRGPPAAPAPLSFRSIALQPGIGTPTSEDIDEWIRDHPPGPASGWTPAEVSARLPAWLGRLGACAPAAIPAHWLQSLWQQTIWLSHNLEWERLGHALLGNLTSLLYATAYLQGPRMEALRRQSAARLIAQIDEQFLADGGHYQRSPGYHAACTVHLLDVLNLAQVKPELFEPGLADSIRRVLPAALHWLSAMTMPDGALAQFNDSALDLSPSSAEILGYAERLGVSVPATSEAPGRCTESLNASGYYIGGNGVDRMIIDCGDGGPEHLYDHAHCDALSYELALNGRRVIIDSGAFDYVAGPQRRHARSTTAHNTVAVDGEEQLEFYGVFAVAWRARPLQARLHDLAGGGWEFTGAHDGYCGLEQKVVHHRRIHFDGNGTWTVIDELQGSGSHTAESYIHLHPGLNASIIDGGVEIRDQQGAPIAGIETDAAYGPRIERTQCFPRIGVAMENDVIVLSARGEVPVKIEYRIVKAA
jgi:uncharacterized heparinase superfamily protein